MIEIDGLFHNVDFAIKTEKTTEEEKIYYISLDEDYSFNIADGFEYELSLIKGLSKLELKGKFYQVSLCEIVVRVEKNENGLFNEKLIN